MAKKSQYFWLALSGIFPVLLMITRHQVFVYLSVPFVIGATAALSDFLLSFVDDDDDSASDQNESEKPNQ